MPDQINETNDSPVDPEALRTLLAARESEIARLNRRIDIDNALREARAIDVEVASILLERAVESTPGGAGIVKAVDELRRRKPFLFEPPRARPIAQSPRSPQAPPRDLERAAADAASTGHRTDLLRYLRLRRKRD